MDNNFSLQLTQPLKSIIHSFWQTGRNFDFNKETIIPKGIVEIIFNFSEGYKIEAQFHNKQYLLARCFINGYNTSPIQLYFSGRQIFFGVRLHPAAVKHIFGIAAGEFANLSVDLSLIDASVNSLWHQMIEQKTFNERVSVFSAWVQNHWMPVSPQDQMLNYFLNDTDQKKLSVTELSKLLCYSPRHLSRKLYSITGMNTEDILSYKKFLSAVNLIHYSNMTLTQIAYHCQFADQSHFIKTFKSLAAITPGDYKKLKSELPGHIYQDVR